MIQGLSVMHEHRPRPTLNAANRLVPARHDQIPLLDVFIVKLFAAPCKFADRPAQTDTGGTTTAVCPVSPHHQQSAESQNLRTIAPDMRAGLTRIAATTLDFLGKWTRVESAADALQLLTEKASLLDSLQSWLSDLELFLLHTRPPQPEPLSVSFMRAFRQILEIIILGALKTSPNLNSELQNEIERWYRIASIVEGGSKAYMLGSGVRSGQGAPPEVH